MACWLVKSEPDVYAITDLARDGRTSWEGVRNYQARIYLRAMKIGDDVLFYHSNAQPTGIVGVGRIAAEAYPDPHQFDPKSPYFDEGSKAADPRWVMVDVSFERQFPRVLTLAEIKADPELGRMEVARKGSRLSVTPVDPAHFSRVCALAGG